MSAGPLCRCRVLYIGSAVPTITKDGLQGIQQPLRERYPSSESVGTKGIDSWLSVWSNGLLLEYVDGATKTESTFFPITTLHYCAGVRYVNVSGFSVEGGGERFIPLDSPFAQIPNSPHPPIFAAIFRRTSGVKVLECHGFICTNERAANALVRCCFHAYADTIYLKMDDKMASSRAIKDASDARSQSPSTELNSSEDNHAADDTLRDANLWNERAIDQQAWQRRQQQGDGLDESSMASSLYIKPPPRGPDAFAKQGRPNLFDAIPNGDRQLLPYRDDFAWRGSSDYGTAAQPGGGPPFNRPFPYAIPYPYRAGPVPPNFGFGAPFFPAPPPVPPPQQANGATPKMKGNKHKPPKTKGAKPSARQQPPPFMHPMMPPYGMPPPPPFPRPPFGVQPMQNPIYAAAYPPHMMPPRFFFAPPFGAPRVVPHPPNLPERPEGSGPIITEAIYDTFPRRGGMNYEEPIYMPSNNSGIVPPHFSYKPDSLPQQHYESYYDSRTYRRKKSKKEMSGSDSDEDEEYVRNTRQWNEYEAGAYRKASTNPTLGENSMAPPGQRVNGHLKSGNPDPAKMAGQMGSRPAYGGKPATPPADYHSDGEMGGYRPNGGIHHQAPAPNNETLATKTEEERMRQETANTRQAQVY